MQQTFGGWSALLALFALCVAFLPLYAFPLCFVIVAGGFSVALGVTGHFVPGNRRALCLTGIVLSPIALGVCLCVQWITLSLAGFL